VVDSFAGIVGGPYVTLEVDPRIEVEPFGLVTRSGTMLPPTAARVAADILTLAGQMAGTVA